MNTKKLLLFILGSCDYFQLFIIICIPESLIRAFHTSFKYLQPFDDKISYQNNLNKFRENSSKFQFFPSLSLKLLLSRESKVQYLQSILLASLSIFII